MLLLVSLRGLQFLILSHLPGAQCRLPGSMSVCISVLPLILSNIGRGSTLAFDPVSNWNFIVTSPVSIEHYRSSVIVGHCTWCGVYDFSSVPIYAHLTVTSRCIESTLNLGIAVMYCLVNCILLHI